MEKTPYNIFEDPIMFRIYPTEYPVNVSEIFLLLHGWTGNENSMSIFLNALPKAHMAISPQGIFHISNDNYGWIDINKKAQLDYSDFLQPAELLFQKLNTIKNKAGINQQEKLNIIGFSQGAALGSVLATQYPQYFNKVCLLSGFLPKNTPQDVNQLSHLNVFISHGVNDQMIPFQQAEITKDFFSLKGAKVTFCEEDQNHKIGAECSVGLRKFLNR